MVTWRERYLDLYTDVSSPTTIAETEILILSLLKAATAACRASCNGLYDYKASNMTTLFQWVTF